MPDPVQLNRSTIKAPKTPADPASGDVVAHSPDTNPPMRPRVNRAFCFEHITDPSTHVVPTPPPPTPNPPPMRRDPFLLELGDVELGSKVQLISLSDDPTASFEKGDVFELSFSGYDSNARTGTVILSADEMEKKAIQPGERLVVRIMDDNGQVSDSVYVHVDPMRWANGGQIDTKDANGAAVRLQGGAIQFLDGFVAPGAPAAANMKSTFGATLTDTSAPKLMADHVSVKTFNWTKEEAEMFQALAGTNYFANSTPEQGAAWCNTPGNLDTIPLPFRDIVAKMGADGGKLLAKVAEAMMPDASKAEIMKTPVQTQHFATVGQLAMNSLSVGGRDTVLVFDSALEPGARVNVQNNSTGTTGSVAQNDSTRRSALRIAMREGDKITVQFSDGNAVAGQPYSFEYDSATRSGKRQEKGGTYKSPLDLQTSTMAKRTIRLNGE